MTDINFTFTGPMTIHIHVYPGADAPVITTPEPPAPPELLDVLPAPSAQDVTASSTIAAPEQPAPPAAKAVTCMATMPALEQVEPPEPLDIVPEAPALTGPRAGVHKTCPICGKPISKKANACRHHRSVVARLLAAGTPRTAWPADTPAAGPVDDPPERVLLLRRIYPTLGARTTTISPSAAPVADLEPAMPSRVPAFLRDHVPTGPTSQRSAETDEACSELDLTELHGSRIA